MNSIVSLLAPEGAVINRIRVLYFSKVFQINIQRSLIMNKL